MKTAAFVFLFLCSLTGYAAKSQEKQIRKILKKNPYLYVPAENTDTRTFWEYILLKNKALSNYEATKRPLKKKTTKKFREYTFYNLTLIPPEDTYFQLQNAYPGLRKTLSGTQEKQFFTITVTKQTGFNAATTPHGYIFLTADLFDLLDYPELLGVLAHEMAHFMLKHSEIHHYQALREKRKNNIIAGVTSALVAASNMYADISYARAGVQTERSASEYTAGTVENLFEAAWKDAMNYYFKYSRSQEIEADIVAMRFLEFHGLDPHFYISALEKMKVYLQKRGYDTSISDNTDDHPSLDFRIALLTALPRAGKIYFQFPEKPGTNYSSDTE